MSVHPSSHVTAFALLTLVLIILAELGSTTKLGFARQIVSLWSIMLQGIALFVARWIVSIPFSLADFAFPSMATILIVLVLQSFADGFVCRKVAEAWRKDVLPTTVEAPATLG